MAAPRRDNGGRATDASARQAAANPGRWNRVTADIPREQQDDPADIALVPHGITRGHALTGLGLLRSRLAEPRTLNSLAAEVHLSRSQLVRSFDAAYGVSPTEYRRRAVPASCR